MDTTFVEALADDMRLCLLAHKDRWPEVLVQNTGLSWYLLDGFAHRKGNYRNPTLKTLKSLEHACRILDPEFLAT